MVGIDLADPYHLFRRCYCLCASEDSPRSGDAVPSTGSAVVTSGPDGVGVGRRDVRVDERWAARDEGRVVCVQIEIDGVARRGVHEEVARGVEDARVRSLDVPETNEVRLVRVAEDGRVDVVAGKVERPLALHSDLGSRATCGGRDPDCAILSMEFCSAIGSHLFLPHGTRSVGRSIFRMYLPPYRPFSPLRPRPDFRGLRRDDR